MNYRLRLISERKPGIPGDISSSNKMIGWGVWSELSKLTNITLSYYESESDNHEEWLEGLRGLPEVDFTLIHSYTPGPIFAEMDTVRGWTKQHVMWISECPYPGMNQCFTFLPFNGTSQVPLPALLDLLDASLAGVEKISGSVLFDHAWGWVEGYNNYTGSVPNLWLDRLYAWLKDYSAPVAQMESTLNEERAKITIPDWVQRIPKAGYLDYLRLTAPFENFIVTHVGSYEHSIIDMAARGIRVLVPTPTVAHYHKDGWMITPEGEPFAPRDTIERLNLPTFSSKEELLAILATPIEKPDRSKFTDISEIARTVDAYCQKVLNGSNR